ncbi:MAG TPA: acyl-CoA dehydrogenase family protein [Acidimicrobiales bacterium]|nr:acyl-CoA dehydrogenase family protein [Acidimicrobiales bacterium]
MDFTFTEEQEAVSEAAAGLFEGLATPERVAAVEAGEDRVDEELWQELARANLLGIAVPEAHGGSGLGMTELSLVLEQQGRRVVPVPLWATLVLGALPIAEFATAAQQARWLPGVAAGDVRLSAALTEVAASRTHRPAVRAVRSGEGWRLDGTAAQVPQAHVAAAILVPALSDEGVVIGIVDPAGAGASLERAVTTDRQVHPHLHLDGYALEGDDVLVGPADGEAAVAWMLERAMVGLAAVAVGVCEEAVRITAGYLNQRHQFGRPLSSFQGTLLRAADAYIDTEAVRVTLWQAAWRMDTGRPATEAAMVAKWWAADAGQRVVHATQHLHGGMGADIEYPIHRYFLWGKQLELMLEGPSAQLARLGDALVEGLGRPVAGAAVGA